ncbi:pathogenesis-related protein 1C-like [Rutidosis leptorrhynchoides]|uniref:pathogenesis-related protein 1C-like n=1 Tax=Rutidosis leptorrhynchoides TaxID=125765 RepID=UPI003A99B6F2
MSSLKISFSLMCFLTLANIFDTTHAQNSQTDYLNSHNSERSSVSVANIAWNATVAAYAQNYANQRIGDCSLVRSNGPYGENVATGSGLTGINAVSLWIAEKSYYTYSTNTCASGHVCSHYTQVVWSSSTQLGCARVQCNSGLYYVICNYYTPGNIAGQSPY